MMETAIKKIAERLDNKKVEWYLAGSASLALRGIEIITNDLDIVTNDTGSKLFRDAFSEEFRFYNGLRGSDNYQILNKDVEVFVNEDDFRKADYIKLGNHKIPLCPLEKLRELYEQTGNKSKLELIDRLSE